MTPDSNVCERRASDINRRWSRDIGTNRMSPPTGGCAGAIVGQTGNSCPRGCRPVVILQLPSVQSRDCHSKSRRDCATRSAVLTPRTVTGRTEDQHWSCGRRQTSLEPLQFLTLRPSGVGNRILARNGESPFDEGLRRGEDDYDGGGLGMSETKRVRGRRRRETICVHKHFIHRS